MPDRDPDLVIDILARIASDRAAGRNPGLAAYLAQFPGNDDLVARCYVGGFATEDTAKPGDAERIGPYRIIELLGRGAQGAVYLAEDTRLPRRIALKVLHKDVGADALVRFRREADALAKLNHPRIAQIVDSGSDAGRSYIALRHVGGETLAKRIESSRARGLQRCALSGDHASTTDEILAYFATAASALETAHACGLVHRDLKPANLMVANDGGPVLLDFGTVRDDAAATLTREGDFIGTPAYLAPEVIRGNTAGPTSDLFALGAALYETLMLARPFDGTTPETILGSILRDEPKYIDLLARQSSKDIAAIVATALEKSPARRYADAGTFAADLHAAKDHRPVRARPASTIIRLVRAAQRRPVTATVIAALVIGAIAAIGSLIVFWSHQAQMLKRIEDRHRRFVEAADTLALRDLVREEAILYPPGPHLIAPLEAWMARATKLIDRSQRHEDRLAEIGHPYSTTTSGPTSRPVQIATAPETTSDEGSRDPAEILWLANLLTELLAERDKVVLVQAKIAERLARSRSYVARITGVDRKSWEQTTAAVKLSPHYSGLLLRPQVGLSPLDRDDESGLFEFAVLETGKVPDRDDDGKLRLTAESAVVLVLIPPGRARIGAAPNDAIHSDDLTERDEQPVWEVDLAPYFIAKHELTQAQWLRMTGMNPSTYRAGAVFFRQAITPLHPVESLPFADAVHALHRVGLSLPTEAQWEYACRAKTTTRWSTGNDAASLRGFANLGGEELGPNNSGRDRQWRDPFVVHAPVGSLRQNPFGLHDMHGNVYEWCAGLYANYDDGEVKPGTGERSPTKPRGRAVRGGAWSVSVAFCRSADRNPAPDTSSVPEVGVRPARPLE